MGLSKQSTGKHAIDNFDIKKENENEKIIALAGNPNVGKSTVFNSLTGMKQHTGNWPGKTVANARGRYKYKDKLFTLVDLPGTYSLMANSVEEEIARDFICFGNPDTTVVVADATCLERNLNLVLQTLELTKNVVLCINLIDEAKRKKIKVDIKKLSIELGIPVVATIARKKKTLEVLQNEILSITENKIQNKKNIIYDDVIEVELQKLLPFIYKLTNGKNARWIALKLLDGDQKLVSSIKTYFHKDENDLLEIQKQIEISLKILENNGVTKDILRDIIVSTIVKKAEEICAKCIVFEKKEYDRFDRKLDSILTSKIFGFPIMFFLLGFILWITITGANYPSQLLADALFGFEKYLTKFFLWTNAPTWLNGILVLGIYRTLAWVVAVMLPPMAIFFPLFTLLEDLGYLPRIAFNLDNFFKKSGCHGKQALTMCMGFGCNAAGIIGCRIIDSPRERLIAIITNAFVPCNGRFPTLIAIISMFFVGFVIAPIQSLVSALILAGFIVFAVIMTLLVSKFLSKTILKGIPSSFTLELPPYRKPQVGKIIVRSIFDRTLFVLGRAIMIAAPAGLIIWLLANIQIDSISLLNHCANFLDPFATFIGLDGYILMAFILGLPANEIVVPIIIMSYMNKGAMLELSSLSALKDLFVSNGWTWTTAICTMIFVLMHWPCGTTLLTIKKETKSNKWTIISFLAPTVCGILICAVIANVARLFGLA